MIPLRDENPVRRTPVVTIAIIVACIAVYFLFQAPSGQEVIDLGDGRLEAPADLAFAVERAAIRCELVTGQLLSRTEFLDTFQRERDRLRRRPDRTRGLPRQAGLPGRPESMFLHGGIFHLGRNMLFLWIFGNNIEDRMGPIRYVLFYLAGGVAATVAHVVSQPDRTIPLVGASGAIAAVMGAYLIWFPQAPIRTMILIIFIRDITARWFLGLLVRAPVLHRLGSGIAWVAHVGGFLFGAAIALIVPRRAGHPVADVLQRRLLGPNRRDRPRSVSPLQRRSALGPAVGTLRMGVALRTGSSGVQRTRGSRRTAPLNSVAATRPPSKAIRPTPSTSGTAPHTGRRRGAARCEDRARPPGPRLPHRPDRRDWRS